MRPLDASVFAALALLARHVLLLLLLLESGLLNASVAVALVRLAPPVSAVVCIDSRCVCTCSASVPWLFPCFASPCSGTFWHYKLFIRFGMNPPYADRGLPVVQCLCLTDLAASVHV